jgi:SNF2 family DNA or RNA helicase
MNPLLDSQMEATNALSSLKVGALFMEAGTGKTRAAMEIIKSVADIGLVLWLCPFQTKDNLKAEVSKHGGFECPFDVHGIETLSSSDRTYLQLRTMLCSHQKPFIVVDESLKIKNWDAKRTRRIIELGSLVEYKLILNGTPLTKDLLDLWAQMEFLSPKILRMGLAQFRNTFCEIVRKTTSYGNRSNVEEWISDYHNIDYLHSLIDPYVFRYDLRLSIGKQYSQAIYALTDDEIEQYKAIKEWFLDPKRIAMLNNNVFLQMIQKMQHSYCCSPDKIDKVSGLITANDPARTIIYCKFKASRDMFTDLFPDQTVLTYGKHSLGLNMQHFNRIVYADKTFDYAQRVQSEHRIYRTGQQDDCRYVDMNAVVGLDGLIDKNIAKKQSLLDCFKEKGIEIVKEL